MREPAGQSVRLDTAGTSDADWNSMVMTRAFFGIGLVAISTALGGCTGFFTAGSAARAQLVADIACPSSRVVAVHAPPDQPPPEVAADPERLALWNEQAKRTPLYDTSGCGQQRRYNCIAYGDYPYHYNCTPYR